MRDLRGARRGGGGGYLCVLAGREDSVQAAAKAAKQQTKEGLKKEKTYLALVDLLVAEQSPRLQHIDSVAGAQDASWLHVGLRHVNIERVEGHKDSLVEGHG